MTRKERCSLTKKLRRRNNKRKCPKKSARKSNRCWNRWVRMLTKARVPKAGPAREAFFWNKIPWSYLTTKQHFRRDDRELESNHEEPYENISFSRTQRSPASLPRRNGWGQVFRCACSRHGGGPGFSFLGGEPP